LNKYLLFNYDFRRGSGFTGETDEFESRFFAGVQTVPPLRNFALERLKCCHLLPLPPRGEEAIFPLALNCEMIRMGAFQPVESIEQYAALLPRRGSQKRNSKNGASGVAELSQRKTERELCVTSSCVRNSGRQRILNRAGVA